MKDTKIKSGLVIALIALLGSSSTFAQSQNRQERKERPTFEQLVEKMDANKDGKLSKEEIKGPLKERFAKVDTDEDGFITAEEFEKAPKPQRRSRREN